MDAFQRFFKKQNCYPHFKSKKNPVQSYTTKNTNDNIAIVGNKIKLPKLGLVKFKQTRALEGRMMRATIHSHASGRFSVSIMCEVPEFQPLPKTHEAIGIDLGITDFAILSDGRKVDNQRFTAQMAKKLARLREKVAFWREDFLHKLTTAFIRQYDVICIEDLNTKGMLKNHKLTKAISDVSWSSFVQKLMYKAKWYGRTIVKINRFFPSSQLCHVCGHRDGKKMLAIREWTCL